MTLTSITHRLVITQLISILLFLWAGENRRICLLREYLNSRANLIPYGSNRSSFLFKKVFEKCLRTAFDISHGSMITLCQYFFHGKYCKKWCILWILLLFNHLYSWVRQREVQQIYQTYTEGCVNWEWDTECSIPFLMAVFDFRRRFSKTWFAQAFWRL